MAENRDTEEQMHIFTYCAQSSSKDIHFIENKQNQRLQKYKRISVIGSSCLETIFSLKVLLN